jgi:hypothetical protein
MSKKPDKTILVIARQNDRGTYDVVTSVSNLNFPVGNYLGKCSGLTKPAAEALAGQWMEFQGKNDHQTKLVGKTRANPNLRQWDVHQPSTSPSDPPL